MATEMRGKMRGKNKTHRRINSNVCYTGSIVYVYSVYALYPFPSRACETSHFLKPASHFIHLLFIFSLYAGFSFIETSYHAVSHRNSLHFPRPTRPRTRPLSHPSCGFFFLSGLWASSATSYSGSFGLILRALSDSSVLRAFPVSLRALSSRRPGAHFAPFFPGPFCPLFLLPLFTP